MQRFAVRSAREPGGFTAGVDGRPVWRFLIADESVDVTVCALALTHFEDMRAPIAKLA